MNKIDLGTPAEAAMRIIQRQLQMTRCDRTLEEDCLYDAKYEEIEKALELGSDKKILPFYKKVRESILNHFDSPEFNPNIYDPEDERRRLIGER